MSLGVPTTVLIGFADSLSAPEVAWSLVESGCRVVAFARKDTRPALCRSRLVDVRYVTDPAESVDRSLADLAELFQQFERPVVMALDDLSLWLIQELLKRTDLPVQVAGAVGWQAEVALDKRLQCEAAIEAGFAVPDTRHVESTVDVRSITGFPVIVKPRLAARMVEGRLGRGRSYTVAGRNELEKLAAEWNGSEAMLVQPLLNGVGEGLFGLARQDGVVCWSGHRRVRMMNPAGSGASACVSVEPDAAIRAVAERFLKAIGWRGMFMIELLRDAAGQLWFMELNGRAWGSMALARRGGFEYPSWAVRSTLDPHFVPSAPAARPPLVCRHLGRELVHLAFVWRGARSNAHAGWPSRATALRQVVRFDRDEKWYNFNPADKKVFWADVWQTLSSQLHGRKRNGSRGLASRVLNRLRVWPARYEQARVRATGEARDLLDGAKRILFVCYGNINRSALAEQHLRQLLGPQAQISSCGFHTPDRRPLDPVMGTLAGDAGIHFPEWSSRTINRELVANADVIFAMEATHLVRLWSEYPEARGRSFLLSCVTSPKTIPLEIQDPHKRSPDVYRRCIREVTFATTAIYDRLKKDEFRLARTKVALRVVASALALYVLLGVLLGASSVAQVVTPALSSQSMPDTYRCPMHPNSIGQSGGKCPICGMALAPGRTEYDTVALEVSVPSPGLIPNRRTTLTLRVRHPQTGALIRAFDEVHTKSLHLFVLSDDLEFYQHIHPTQKRDGAFTIDVTVPKPGIYRILADFFPHAGTPQFVQRMVVTAGYAGRLGNQPASTPDDVTPKTLQGTDVTLHMAPPIAGREQLVTFELADERSQSPVTNLQPYLGAWGHLLVAAADRTDAFHSHPVEPLSTPGGPRVVFQMMFPRPGSYRMWAQFQRADDVLTVPFTVSVKPQPQR